MPRFFIMSSDVIGDTVTVRGDDAHHISRSLRMAAGEHITVCDSAANEYDCVLTDFFARPCGGAHSFGEKAGY